MNNNRKIDFYDYDNRETRRKKGRRSGFKLSAKLPKKRSNA